MRDYIWQLYRARTALCEQNGEVGDVLADACGIALGCAVGVGLRNDRVNYTVN